MAKESFFQKIKNFLFGESEESITEFSQPEEADVSIQDPEVSDLPSFEFSPMVEGLAEATAEFFDNRADVGREVDHVDVRYRLEHEPYRYEPDGDHVVWVTEAHLYELHPLSGDVVKIHKLDPLNIKIPDKPTSVVYAEFNVGKQGHVIADPAGQPDDSLYRLKVAESLPDVTHFQLPNGEGVGGANGHYVVPLFYFKNRKLLRDHWNDEEDDPRGVQLYGGLKGHRGPYWWVRGYNHLQNLGSGKKIYKNYVKASDAKTLRSLDERGQTLSSPFTGNAQISVEYNDDETEIDIFGNRYNKHWKIGGKGVGIVEDGLVTCLTDLTCKDLSNLTLNTTSVLSSASGTATVITSGSTVSVPKMPDLSQVAAVLTSAGTVTVALEPQNSNMVSVVSASAVTTVAAPVTSGNLTAVVNSVGATTVAAPVTSGNLTAVVNSTTATNVVGSVGSTSVINSVDTTTVAEGPAGSDYANNVWSGGTASAGGGLTAVKVAGCGSTGGSGDTCYWVLGYEASGSYASSPPTFPSLITGANQSTPVIKSLSTTSVLNSSTATNVHNSVNTTSVLNSSTTTNVAYETTDISVLYSSTTTNVAYETTDESVIKSSGSPVSVIASLNTAEVATAGNTVNVIKSNVTPVDVITTATTATVLTTGTTVAVYAPTGTASNVTVLREAPDGTSENSLIKVVECPTTDGCPASE